MSISTIILLLALIYFVIIPSFKTQIFSVKKLVIMPAVFVYLNYDAVMSNFRLHALGYVMIIMGIIVGVLMGALFRKNAVVRSDRSKMLIELKGSYFSLFLFLGIFAVHFVIGYLQSVNPQYLLHISIGEQVLLFLLTGTSCVSIGSNCILLYKYLHAPHSDLVEPAQKESSHV